MSQLKIDFSLEKTSKVFHKISMFFKALQVKSRKVVFRSLASEFIFEYRFFTGPIIYTVEVIKGSFGDTKRVVQL